MLKCFPFFFEANKTFLLTTVQSIHTRKIGFQFFRAGFFRINGFIQIQSQLQALQLFLRLPGSFYLTVQPGQILPFLPLQGVVVRFRLTQGLLCVTQFFFVVLCEACT